jgi:hypothetical protein
MANAQKGEVAFEIAGKSYTLVMDISAVCELEALFSTPVRDATIQEIGRSVERGSVRHIRGFLWAALRRHHKDLTLEKVSDLIEAAGGIGGFGNTMEALAKSLAPDAEDQVPNDRPRTAQATTGASSTSAPEPSA